MLDGACEHFTIIMFVLVLVLKHIILKCLIGTFSSTKHLANFKHVSKVGTLCLTSKV